MRPKVYRPKGHPEHRAARPTRQPLRAGSVYARQYLAGLESPPVPGAEFLEWLPQLLFRTRTVFHHCGVVAPAQLFGHRGIIFIGQDRKPRRGAAICFSVYRFDHLYVLFLPGLLVAVEKEHCRTRRDEHLYRGTLDDFVYADFHRGRSSTEPCCQNLQCQCFFGIHCTHPDLECARVSDKSVVSTSRLPFGPGGSYCRYFLGNDIPGLSAKQKALRATCF